jgi:predicted Zn-dependent peptidase
MKRKFLLTCFIVAVWAGAFAQTTTTSFYVNGIKVIFKPTQKKIINIRVYFRGGVTNYSAGQAGIENLALRAAAECGTEKYATGALRDSTEKYGIFLSGRSTADYGYIQLNCISMYFDEGWDFFSEAVNKPVFDETQVRLLKTKSIGEINSSESNPGNRLYQLQMKVAFANTPYETDPAGTEQTLSALTAADLKNYYKTLLNKNRMFIVAVGNISKQELYEKILYAFDSIPSSPYEQPVINAPVWTGNNLISEQRNLKINYVGAVMGAPEFTSVDYVPFMLAFSGVAGNVYRDLHTPYQISYGNWSNVWELRIPMAILGATSNYPKEVMTQMMKVLKSVQNNGYDEEWLQHLKTAYIARNYFEGQSSAAVTQSLGLAEILGNWQYADDMPQLVNMVTIEQMNRVINFYISGVKWAYLGNLEAIEGFKPPAN